MFSVTRIRNGEAFLLNVGTHSSAGRTDLILVDEGEVHRHFHDWLCDSESYQARIQQEMELYECGLCHKTGVPSVWQLERDGERVELCTRCANRLRGGGYDVDVATLTIREKEVSDEPGLPERF